MQKTLVAAALAATLGMGGAAYAADVYAGGGYKDVALPPLWTGFYLSSGAGGGEVDHHVSGKLDFRGGGAGGNIDGIAGTGVLGTVRAGYDRQIDSRFVLGIFAEGDSPISRPPQMGILAVLPETPRLLMTGPSTSVAARAYW